MSGERIVLGGRRKGLPIPRLLLLVCVILVTGGVFSRHYENVIGHISASGDISDETGSLTPERLRLLRDASQTMRRAFGISLRVHIRPGPVTPPPATPDLLFFGLDTADYTAVTVLPPLLDRALPPELAQSLSSGYFDPYFAAGTWPEGLNSAVLAILEALRDKH